ncbi:MAG: hypothetical protein GW878_04295, partial [Acidobacteria bacterium]|nr:hypothetical protein [Acidobacteriota bacterium]
VFVPFSEKGAKSLITVKQVLKDKVPIFTCQYGLDKDTDVNKDLFALGIPSYPRKTVGVYLESLGASTDAPPPFDPPQPETVLDECKERVAAKAKLGQLSFF